MRAKGIDQRNIGGVAPLGDERAANARHVVARIKRVPVSYTHLDVYKRQHLCCIIRLRYFRKITWVFSAEFIVTSF